MYRRGEPCVRRSGSRVQAIGELVTYHSSLITSDVGWSRSMKPRYKQFAMTLLAVLLALACASCGPEAGRARGGGPGADVGNKPVPMVPKSKVFTAETP